MIVEPVSPLAIPTRPFPGESLAGLLSRATSENVLVANGIILNEVGLPARYAGSIGFYADPVAKELAAKIGCDHADIRARSHPYVTGRVVSFGDARLDRGDLDLKTRWISPLSLQNANYHRNSWMCRPLLPFCPESGELLVGACPHCDAPLSWKRSWSADTCGQCRKQILPRRFPIRIEGPTLERYQLFARLLSADPKIRCDAVAKLSPESQNLPAFTLRTMILQLGAIAHGIRYPAAGFRKLDLHPRELVDLLAAGTNLLVQGNDAIRSLVRGRLLAAQEAGPNAIRDLIAQIRSVGRKDGCQAQAAFIRVAVPETFEFRTRALADLIAPVVLSREAAEIMALDSNDLRRICSANLIKHVVVREGAHNSIQFDRAEVEALALANRSFVRSSVIEQKLDIPHYAMEQLVCITEVETVDHPALDLVRPGIRLTQASAASILSEITGGFEQTPAPADAARLGIIMRAFPGPKPWGSVLAAMLRRSFAYWRSSDIRLARNAFVRPTDIWPLVQPFDEAAYPNFQFQRYISQVDAQEMLGCGPIELARIVDAGHLRFDRRGKAKVCDREAVLRLSELAISSGEVAARAGLNPKSAWHIVSALGLKPHALGWIRAEVEPLIESLSGPSADTSPSPSVSMVTWSFNRTSAA